MANLLSRHFHYSTPGHNEFAKIVPGFLKTLNSSFEPTSKQKYKTCLNEISKLFLKFIINIEKLLGQLTAKRKGKKNSKITNTDETVIKLIKGMKTVEITKIAFLN